MNRLNILWILIYSSSALFGQEVLDSSFVQREQIVYFQSDSYTLSEEDRSKLLKLCQQKERFKTYNFFVDAHTDDVGSEAYNQKLSEKRKQTIVDFLLEQQIQDSLIESNFHGESLRVALSEDEVSRQLNRRAIVQLIIKKKFLYVKGVILDDETNEPIEAEIELKSKNFRSKTKTDSEGKFKIASPINADVSIEVVAKNYFIESSVMKKSEIQQGKLLKIPLPRIALGKKFVFKNMLFYGNSSKMLPKSLPVLNHLRRFMFVNDDQCIEIAGHINRPSSDKTKKNTSDFKLSIARSLMVYDELVKASVHPDRLLARGYGNWEMIYPYATAPKDQEKNRRVEIIIAMCDSTKFLVNHNTTDRFRESDYTDKKFSEADVESDIKNFPLQAKKDILKQIREMKKKGIDPTKFTYREMLKALPGLPQ